MKPSVSAGTWRAGWLFLSLTWLTGFSCLLAESAELEHFKIENRKGDVDEWSWRGNNVTVFGILRKPEGNGPFPAIIISHGAGAGKKERRSLRTDPELVRPAWRS